MGGLPDTLDSFDHFGSGLAALGDLDGDGVGDLAVGAESDANGGGIPRGCVWVLFLEPDATVKRYRKIEGFGPIGVGSFAPNFGSALAPLGDLDGDGVLDLAVGAYGEDNSGADAGVCYALLLRPDGSVKAQQRIGEGLAGFTGHLASLDLFGCSLANLGDLDGDGVTDVAIGARGDGSRRGAVWVLFLNPDGTVHAHQKINASEGGFVGTLASGEFFGSSVAGLGDLDGDAIPDLAVGASSRGGTFSGEGAVWILFMNPNGTVRAQQEISSSQGGFVGGLDFVDLFGSALANLGDVDGDGIVDLGVGSPGDQDGGTMSFDHRGAAYVLLLNANGTVRAQRKISLTQGGFTGALSNDAFFGNGLADLGDLDGDGRKDVFVGASRMDPDDRGIVWALSIQTDGRVAANHPIRDGEGGFGPSVLENEDAFGRAVAALGDLDGDGIGDVAVGAPVTPLTRPGSVFVCRLTAAGDVGAFQAIGDGQGGLPAGSLAGFHSFGRALAPLGDLDGDGVADLAAAATEFGGGGGVNSRLGTVFILFSRSDGTVRSHRQVRVPRPLLSEGDEVGRALASLGDLDGDGVTDLIAGAPGDDDGPSFSDNRGAAWVLFLNADGTLRAYQKISATQGGFTGLPQPGTEFGGSVTSLGDLDRDGVCDVAVGAPLDNDGRTAPSSRRGAVYVLFLRSDGTVRAHTKISELSGGFTGTLVNESQFGSALTSPGDLDGDGNLDLVVSATRLGTGTLWVLFLNADGTVRAHQKIDATHGGFTGTLDAFDRFGSGLATLGDRDGDGAADLAVGADGDDDGGGQAGALWLLDLDGIACLDFSAGDDVARTPFVNGRSLSPQVGFTRTIALTSDGANLGPAVFDSTPLGPNDPSQDRDLLVGRGALLILQNNQAPAQTVPGIFDHPNDDQDGGTLRVAFAHAPVLALRLNLVDIDLGAGQMASVRLFDAAGLTRTFLVPAGWTEDLLTHGPPAYRTLDLTSLAPQPGYVAIATASELPGFDERTVTRLEVHLGRSGAIDDLCWDPHPED